MPARAGAAPVLHISKPTATDDYVSNLEHEVARFRTRAKSAEEQALFLRKQTQELRQQVKQAQGVSAYA